MIESIKDNVSGSAASNMALEILPKKSLQVLNDLLVPDEKCGQLEQCQSIYTKFAEELTAAIKEGGLEAGVAQTDNRTFVLMARPL